MGDSECVGITLKYLNSMAAPTYRPSKNHREDSLHVANDRGFRSGQKVRI
jgi:hypothetical protein